MTTIIDALVVTLGLDAKEFQKGQKQSGEDLNKLKKDAEKQAKDMEAAGKKAASFFGEVKNQALALAAVLLGGIGLEELVKQTAQADAAAGRFAKNVGMSTSELTSWEGAVRLAGGTAAGFDQSVSTLNESIQKFKLFGERSQNFDVLNKLGISDDQIRTLKTTEILERLSNGIQRFPRPEGISLLKSLGMDEGTANLLIQGSDATEQLRRQVALYRPEVDAAGDASARLGKQWEILKLKGEGFADTLIVSLEPSLNDVFEAMGTDGHDVMVIFVELLVAAANTAVAFGRALGAVAAGIAAIAHGDFKALPLIWKEYAADVDAAQKKQDELFAKLEAPPNASGSSSASGSAGSAPSGVGETSGLPRGVRNKNPGNIRMGPFARSMGAVGQDADGFAIFPDMATGARAATGLLTGYMRRGLNTVGSIISTWAPSTENNTGAYVADVSRQLGVGAGEALSADKISALARAIYGHENGARYTSQILAAAGGGAGGAAAGSTSSVQTTINGPITINTQATDAKGIASALHGAIANHPLVAQAATGQQ